MKNYLDYFIPKYQNAPGPLPGLEERNGILYMNGQVVGEKPLSAKDPLLSLWVEGAALGKPLEWAGRGLWAGTKFVAPKTTGYITRAAQAVGNKINGVTKQVGYFFKPAYKRNQEKLDEQALQFIRGEKPAYWTAAEYGKESTTMSRHSYNLGEQHAQAGKPYINFGSFSTETGEYLPNTTKLLLNKDLILKDVVSPNKELLIQRLGIPSNSTEEQVYNSLLTRFQGKSPYEVMAESEDLLGMVLGYGRDNSILFRATRGLEATTRNSLSTLGTDEQLQSVANNILKEYPNSPLAEKVLQRKVSVNPKSNGFIDFIIADKNGGELSYIKIYK